MPVTSASNEDYGQPQYLRVANRLLNLVYLGRHEEFQAGLQKVAEASPTKALQVIQLLCNSLGAGGRDAFSQIPYNEKIRDALVSLVARCWPADAELVVQATSQNHATTILCSSPVHFAAAYGSLPATTRLGPNLFLVNPHGKNALQIAIQNQWPNTGTFVERFLSAARERPVDHDALARAYVDAMSCSTPGIATQITGFVENLVPTETSVAPWCCSLRRQVYELCLDGNGGSTMPMLRTAEQVEQYARSMDADLSGIEAPERELLDKLDIQLSVVADSANPIEVRIKAYKGLVQLINVLEKIGHKATCIGERIASFKTSGDLTLFELLTESDVPHWAKFILLNRDPSRTDVERAFHKRAIFTCAALLEKGHGEQFVHGRTIVRSFPWEKEQIEPQPLKDYIIAAAEAASISQALFPPELAAYVHKTRWEAAWIYQCALGEVLSDTKCPDSRHPFEAMLGDILYRMPPDGFRLLVADIDREAYNSFTAQPHERVLMASLGHQGRASLNADNIGHVTEALTAPMNFEGYNEKVDLHWSDVDLWKQVGRLAYYSPLFKYDARRSNGLPCLMERFGFERYSDGEAQSITRWKEVDDDIRRTPRYLLCARGFKRPLAATINTFTGQEEIGVDRRTVLRLTRYEIIIAFPGKALLVIPNGSPFLPTHPYDAAMYYMDHFGDERVPKRVKDLLDLTPTKILHICQSGLFPPFYDDFKPHLMYQLVSQLRVILRSYFSRHFDTDPTSAWRYDPATKKHVLLGAHRSQGFSEWVDAWLQHVLHGKKSLALKLVPLEGVPVASFSFDHPGLGAKLTQLPLDVRTLRAFRMYGEGRARMEELEVTGVWNFISAALKNRAYPIVVDRGDHDLK